MIHFKYLRISFCYVQQCQQIVDVYSYDDVVGGGVVVKVLLRSCRITIAMMIVNIFHILQYVLCSALFEYIMTRIHFQLVHFYFSDCSGFM